MEPKQAEFLIQDLVPWELVTRVAVMSEDIYGLAVRAFAHAVHQPPVDVIPRWYF